MPAARGVNTMALLPGCGIGLVISAANLLPFRPSPRDGVSLFLLFLLAAGIVLGLLAVVMAFVVNTLRIRSCWPYTRFQPRLEGGLDQWRSFSFLA